MAAASSGARPGRRGSRSILVAARSEAVAITFASAALSRIDDGGFPSPAAGRAPRPPCFRKKRAGPELSSRHNLARNRCKQHLRVTATAMIGMHADGRYLGVVGRLHSLARHRNKLSIDLNSEERSQFM